MPASDPRRNPPRPELSGSVAERAPRVRSDRLLGGHRRLIIEHAGEDYCLRLTRNGRLILTKD